MAVDLLVIHAISLPPGEFGGPYVDDLFLGSLNPDVHPFFQEIASLKVSSHFFIRRQGDVVQYVPVNRRAWHAGVSLWRGRSGCNDFSIGIELEGDDKTPFQDVQYQHLVGLVRLIQTNYPTINPHHIVGHKDIAPERKWDPGPHFDWVHFHTLLDQTATPSPWPVVWES